MHMHTGMIKVQVMHIVELLIYHSK